MKMIPLAKRYFAGLWWLTLTRTTLNIQGSLLELIGFGITLLKFSGKRKQRFQTCFSHTPTAFWRFVYVFWLFYFVFIIIRKLTTSAGSD